jgi:hypothetical protein
MLNIIYKPNLSQILELKVWLEIEFKVSENGFYNHWDFIKTSFEEGRALLFENNNEIIGFAQWRHLENSIELNLFNIRRTNQKMGYGSQAYDLLENYLKDKGNIAINLFCEPRESETFWNMKGFIKTPETGCAQHELSYWKPIIDIIAPKSEVESKDKIEVWNVYPHQTNGLQAKWMWDISSPLKSILHYIDYDWNMRITLNGKIINESKVKYITEKTDELICSPYLYIPTSKLLEIKSRMKEKQP